MKHDHPARPEFRILTPGLEAHQELAGRGRGGPRRIVVDNYRTLPSRSSSSALHPSAGMGLGANAIGSRLCSSSVHPSLHLLGQPLQTATTLGWLPCAGRA